MLVWVAAIRVPTAYSGEEFAVQVPDELAWTTAIKGETAFARFSRRLAEEPKRLRSACAVPETADPCIAVVMSRRKIA